MFIGEYHHAIDPKGRVIFPAKFRENLGDLFMMTKGIDGCIAVYTLEEWKNIEERIHSMPNGKTRNLKRFLFASANECSLDKQGRALIPPNLREYAELQKDLAIVGTSNSIEIWNEEKWNKLCGELTEETIIEAMDELGF